ncbi:MAG TPA: D-glycero-beta-D-manno-heptose 1-phosphate adenylyltransferase [Solirubrobacteraceae bacterium]|nr:D-glycero-beta-D-manno-heptose 1-phosphate adenylyltransferase [Solirubrobacteraceae bacterium]
MTSLVVVGDALLDRDVSGTVERLCPDAPVPVVDQVGAAMRPGGAGLAAALAAADGHDVTLITALAMDGAGEDLRGALSACGVDVVDLGCVGGATVEKVRVLCDGRSLLRLDRGGGGAVGALTAEARAAIGWADGVLVADYGRGMAACADVRAALRDRVAAGGCVVWDPHPRGAVPVHGVTLVTPNAFEASAFAVGISAEGPEGSERSVGVNRGDVLDAAGCAARLAAAWGCDWVCVTRGASGAVLCGADGGSPLAFAAPGVHGGDPCGAGDRFATSAAAALAGGADAPTAIAAAVEAATAFVAAGGATATRFCEGGGSISPGHLASTRPTPPADGPLALVERVRAQGGTVVATGGCFDLLHAGHVQTLQAARALGDALVVCLNGDASVRRLKGADRPLVGEDDRAAVLQALGCVDVVAIFDEDTPVELLRRLRPHVWAKGGDYAHEQLPETDALSAWGGRTVILPFVDGRSTSRLIEEVALRG